MRLCQKKREILVVVNFASNEHLMMERFCMRHFKKILRLSHSIVVFSHERELLKKEHFLYYLQKISKTNLGDFEQIKNTPIRIKISKKNPQKRVKINVSFAKDHFNIASDDFCEFFDSYFCHVFQALRSNKNFELNEISIVKLSKMFKKSFLTGSLVSFSYDKDFFASLIDKINQSKRNINFLLRDDLGKNLKVLGCTPKDTNEEIKTKYYTLIKKFHPDKVFSKDEEIILLYTKKFQEINNAWNFVKLKKSIA